MGIPNSHRDLSQSLGSAAWARCAALAWGALCLACAILVSEPVQAEPRAPGFVQTGVIHDPQLTELSGLAVSRSRPGVYWGHNDSGNAPTLFALSAKGKVLQVVTVLGVQNHDWEDIASYRDAQGRSWLLISDTGDNFSVRDHVAVIVVPEPAPGQNEVAPTRVIDFTWESGPMDCESLAVDLPDHQLLFAQKKAQGAGLYALPMDATSGAVAHRIADLPSMWPDKLPLVTLFSVRPYRGVVTGMDLSVDGQTLVMLTLRHLFEFQRRPGQSWAAALQQHQKLPLLPILESVALGPEGHDVLIGNEGAWVHLYRHVLGKVGAAAAAP